MNELFGLPADSLFISLLVLAGLILVLVGLSAWRFPLAFRLGIRNLPRRRAQTLLVIGGLALSTMIITSALGIGDTIDYSSRASVYQDLGAIDIQVGSTGLETQAGLSLGSSQPDAADDSAAWFDADVGQRAAALVDGETIDAVVPAIVQTLPVVNSASNLSEAAVQVRGLGQAAGGGFTIPAGLADLQPNQVLINDSLAGELDAAPGDTLLLVRGQPTPFEVAGLIPDGELAGSRPSVILPLPAAQAFFGQPEQINTLLISNAGDSESGLEVNAAAAARLAEALPDLPIHPVKADGVAAAASSAEFITTLFVTFGSFSILSGVLLIFLIFTVLAAERRSELGISRAVGLQRTDLIRQFVTEGLAYDLIAAAVGAALGVGAALLLSGTILELLTGSAGLEITPRVSPRSVAIGYLLGLVVTFFTVSISAVRISRINIIAAIRDLNLPRLARESQWTLLLRPLQAWREALRRAGEGNVAAALRLFLLAGPRAALDFWMGLLARGPVLLILGFAMAWVGVNAAGQAGVYGLGVSLFLIGLGQLAAWIGLPQRAAYSGMGLALILYWSLPTREAGRLAELGRNPGDFFISGLFLVGGAIVLFLYNAEQLLTLFAGLLSRLGRLLPVARVSIAYPVAAKGRTATTLAMFSLIVFTLVGTATISNTFSNFLDVESGSGGYDLLVQTNPFNPVPEQALAAQIDRLTRAGTIAPPTALAALASGPVQARSPDMARPAGYLINGADEAFFTSQQLRLSAIARSYDDEAAVWAAVQADPTLVVIDNFSVDRGGDPTFQRNEDAFLVASIGGGETTFDPVQITITGRDGTAQAFTVVGVLGSAPAFYGATMNTQAAAGLGYDTANRYLLRLPPAADAQAAANAIESAFSRSGLQVSLPKQDLAESRSSVNSIFYLLQGFMGLGLLIGIAALGVVTIRAVVERRQQIGVLRAIGFQRGMVQGVFLLENVFVSGLGTLIGYGLALTFAYNLYLQVAADQGLAFLPPWPTLIGIGLGILATVLLTAWLHARQSARVVIAEALRYQG